jgi:acyl-CoA reductase-like NAD-dependent aldehyde dehydrogenase
MSLHDAMAVGNAAACGGSCSIGVTVNEAQRSWAALRVDLRLKVLREARLRMAERGAEFAEMISPRLARSKADTLVMELLPLLDACKFLERNAERLLEPRKLGRSGRPFWLSGVWAEVHHAPLGHVLVIAPANFPLFLAGVQVLQALAVGNSVTWKPGACGRAVALLVEQALREAGLPDGLLRVAEESVEAGREALSWGPDKVVFTGSQAVGQAVLTRLAETATPAVVEMSGADAIVVMPSADLKMVAKAVAFGLRLNGGAVCMSPRRLFAMPETMELLKPLVRRALEEVPPVRLDVRTAEILRRMVGNAIEEGALLAGSLDVEAQRPLLMENASAEMEISRSDVFAPVISLIAVPTMLHLFAAYARCEYALTAAIFCGKDDFEEARMLARSLKAGTVLINDVIAPTADPRVPFGGRGASGYGVTRGAEGLLEMTAVKTLLVRKRGRARHFDATSNADVPMFEGMILASHGRGWRARLDGLMQLVKGSRRVGK